MSVFDMSDLYADADLAAWRRSRGRWHKVRRGHIPRRESDAACVRRSDVRSEGPQISGEHLSVGTLSIRHAFENGLTDAGSRG